MQTLFGDCREVELERLVVRELALLPERLLHDRLPCELGLDAHERLFMLDRLEPLECGLLDCPTDLGEAHECFVCFGLDLSGDL